MEKIKSFIYSIVHAIIDCADEDLYEYQKGFLKCKKCDREYIKYLRLKRSAT